MDKSIVDPPDARVTIGQELTYHLEVSLIEGTTQNVTLVDALPAGTVFVPGSVVVPSVPGVVFGTQTATYNAAANTLTISWDSVTIPGFGFRNGKWTRHGFFRAGLRCPCPERCGEPIRDPASQHGDGDCRSRID